MYTQCTIKYENKGIGTAWIPDAFAKKHKNIIVGKNKNTGVRAKVLEVFGTTDIDMAKERKSWNVGGL